MSECRHMLNRRRASADQAQNHPARCGSSLQKNAVCGLHGGCSSRSAQTTIQGARISVSYPLLDGYDEPEILRSQTAKSVSQALMSDSSPAPCPFWKAAFSHSARTMMDWRTSTVGTSSVQSLRQ